MTENHNVDRSLSEAHWALVENAPLAAFSLIAGADGSVDRKEQNVLARRMTASLVRYDDSPILVTAVRRAAPELEDRLADLAKKPAQELTMMVAAARQAVRDDAGTAAAERFSAALYAMAYQVARASGGMLGLSSKINKNEKAALNELKRVLMLP